MPNLLGKGSADLRAQERHFPFRGQSTLVWRPSTCRTTATGPQLGAPAQSVRKRLTIPRQSRHSSDSRSVEKAKRVHNANQGAKDPDERSNGRYGGETTQTLSHLPVNNGRRTLHRPSDEPADARIRRLKDIPLISFVHSRFRRYYRACGSGCIGKSIPLKRTCLRPLVNSRIICPSG